MAMQISCFNKFLNWKRFLLVHYRCMLDHISSQCTIRRNCNEVCSGMAVVYCTLRRNADFVAGARHLAYSPTSEATPRLKNQENAIVK